MSLYQYYSCRVNIVCLYCGLHEYVPVYSELVAWFCCCANLTDHPPFWRYRKCSFVAVCPHVGRPYSNVLYFSGMKQDLATFQHFH